MKYKVEIEGTDRLIEDLAGNRRGRKFAVIEHPWQSESFILSWHASWYAAQRSADRYSRNFAFKNPGGYGYSWEPYYVQ